MLKHNTILDMELDLNSHGRVVSMADGVVLFLVYHENFYNLVNSIKNRINYYININRGSLKYFSGMLLTLKAEDGISYINIFDKNINILVAIILSLLLFGLMMFIVNLFIKYNFLSKKVGDLLTDILSSIAFLFGGYCLWFFGSNAPIYNLQLVKNINDLKTLPSGNNSGSFVLLFSILDNKPAMFITCAILISIPVIFFIYSVLTVVSAVNNLDLTKINGEWFTMFLIGAGGGFYFIIKTVDTTIFSENFGLWLSILHKRLFISSISMVILAYYLIVAYEFMQYKGYFKKFVLVIEKLFKVYQINMWKKRLFAMVVSSSLYVFLITWSPLWPYPLNVLGEWAALIAVSLYFYLTWCVPVWTAVGSVLSGSTVSRVGQEVKVTKKFVYIRKPGVQPGSMTDRLLRRHALLQHKRVIKGLEQQLEIVNKRNKQFDMAVKGTKLVGAGLAWDALYGGQLIKSAAETVDKKLPEHPHIDEGAKIS